MNSKFYTCFILRGAAGSDCRELGSVVEVDSALHHLLSVDDVAEMLADSLEVAEDAVTVFHLSRLH